MVEVLPLLDGAIARICEYFLPSGINHIIYVVVRGAHEEADRRSHKQIFGWNRTRQSLIGYRFLTHFCKFDLPTDTTRQCKLHPIYFGDTPGLIISLPFEALVLDVEATCSSFSCFCSLEAHRSTNTSRVLEMQSRPESSLLQLAASPIGLHHSNATVRGGVPYSNAS